MEYTVNKLAKISGVSTRTLRYYDEIGLLKPAKIRSNGYRIYGKVQMDKLQQILFYREMGVSLEEIKKLLSDPNYDQAESLINHKKALLQKKEQLQVLIETVDKTIRSLKGEIEMKDYEKFEGFKRNLVDENERKYGNEIRSKYGDDAVDASNAKLINMSKEQYEEAQRLSAEINETLAAAMNSGDPAGELAQKACELHKQWLCIFWPDGMYTKEAHRGLGRMYVEDERFKAYYDSIAEGCAEFLCKALDVYCTD